MRKLILIGWLVLGSVLYAQAQTCRGTQTLTEPSGTFDDGSGRRQYTNNLDCRWLIQPPGARFLRLEFLDFITEPEADIVTIYDGPTTESPILVQVSGFARLEPIFTSQGTALVRFETNGRTTDEGWTLSYRSLDERPACEGRQDFFEPAGSIEVGRPYTANLDCEWLLFNPGGGLAPIRIDFDRFRTEAERDVVEIYNGFERGFPLVASFSGTSLPDILEFEAEAVLIVFRTDDQNQDEGWRLNYRWEMPEPTCTGQTRLTEPQGVFDDGSGPDRPYTGTLNCEWLIEPVAGTPFLRFDFDAFDLGFGASVSIFDGLEPDAQLLGVFNFFSLPNGPIFTTQGRARVLFENFGGSGMGWTLRYRGVDVRPSCAGLQTRFDAQGTIEDGSGPQQDYSNDLDCSWQLFNPMWMPGLLRIDFDEFRTESGHDVLEIYNGFDRESPPVATFSGGQLPDALELTATGVLIVFRTNERNTDAGWRLRYEWMEPEPTCAGQTRFTAPSGSFDDGSGPEHDFTSGLDCEWLIEPTPAARYLRLEFTEFDLGFSDAFITVYDGPTRDAELIALFGPGEQPRPVFTSGGTALVVFETAFGAGPGWTLRYESVESRPTCSGRRIVTDFSGTIDDGSGPTRDYDNDLDCEWLLLSPLGEAQPLRIDFEELNIDVLLDALTIHEGFDRNGRILGVYTGNRLPPPLNATAEAVTLVFRTNRTRTAAGWRLRYAWPEPDPSCSGRQTLTDTEGFVADKEREGVYTNNLNCEWLIAPPGASALNVQFEFFDTHSPADFVEVYQGAEALEANRLLRHSGRRTPEPLVVPGGTALVRFVTDDSGVGFGWVLNYTAGGTARSPQARPQAPLVVYPNPATDRCTLRWPAGEAARLTVVDAAGRVIETRAVESAIIELEVAGWASGLYALRLETVGGALYTGRLLKP